MYLVLQPLGGDEVQFLKAGIIEHPDVFVLNKSDQPAATTMYHQLKGSLWLARPFEEAQPPVLRVRTSVQRGSQSPTGGGRSTSIGFSAACSSR